MLDLDKNIGPFKQLYMLDYSKSEEHNFDTSLGFAYGYNKGTHKYYEEDVTIYVYPIKNRANENRIDLLLKEFSSSLDLILKMHTDYEIYATPPKDKLKIDDNAFHNVYNIDLNLEKDTYITRTFLCIFIYKEYFVKVRYTTQQVDSSLNEMLRYLSKYMEKI